MRASVVILGFLATLTMALPEARPEAAISCQSVSLINSNSVQLEWSLTAVGNYDVYI